MMFCDACLPPLDDLGDHFHGRRSLLYVVAFELDEPPSHFGEVAVQPGPGPLGVPAIFPKLRCCEASLRTKFPIPARTARDPRTRSQTLKEHEEEQLRVLGELHGQECMRVRDLGTWAVWDLARK